MNGSLVWFAMAQSLRAFWRYDSADGGPLAGRLLSGMFDAPRSCVATLSEQTNRLKSAMDGSRCRRNRSRWGKDFFTRRKRRCGLLDTKSVTVERELSRGLGDVEESPHLFEHGAEHLRRQHASIRVVARTVIAGEQRDMTNRAAAAVLER